MRLDASRPVRPHGAVAGAARRAIEPDARRGALRPPPPAPRTRLRLPVSTDRTRRTPPGYLAA
ncbi:hypothetical protein ACFW88_27380 [Streptomyces anandii]|uniref:Uncharacterized protein n=1 Tax=Streptomyces anandii TaxID=285454 RepID=A0ABW6HD03_9ACTN